MSIKSLFQPNNYNIYAESFTQTAAGLSLPVPTLSKTVVTDALITLSTGTISAGSVRGQPMVIPAQLPFVDFNVAASTSSTGVQSTVITVKIPQFTITNMGGATPTSIYIAIPPSFCPSSAEIASDCIVQNGTSTYLTAVAGIDENSRIEITLVGAGVMFGVNCGLIGDLCLTYSFD
jgi:hypothetical protein